MAVTKVVMPKLSEAMAEGKVLKWLKREGDKISGGDIIAEIESDKADIELEAFGSGVLRKIVVEVGSSVPVGQTIAVIADPGEDISSALAGAPAPVPAKVEGPSPAHPAPAVARVQPAQPPTPTSPPVAPAGGRVRASPLARKIAERAGVDLHLIKGSGPAGRVIRRDVEEYVSAAGVRPAAVAPTAPGEYEDRPLSSMRRTIARRMAQSKATVPHFYLTTEVDMEPLSALRDKLNAGVGQGDAKITFTHLLIKAGAQALRRHPEANVSFNGETARYYRRVHVSMAVALDEGLVTPVIQDADQKSIGQIAREARELSERGRARKLKPEEFTGGTFSISNLGMFDVEEFSAVINPPEGMILAVGAIVPKPVVVEGQVVVRRRMRLTLSIDHRVIDGAMGGRFLRTLRGLLEHPAQISL